MSNNYYKILIWVLFTVGLYISAQWVLTRSAPETYITLITFLIGWLTSLVDCLKFGKFLLRLYKIRGQWIEITEGHENNSIGIINLRLNYRLLKVTIKGKNFDNDGTIYCDWVSKELIYDEKAKTIYYIYEVTFHKNLKTMSNGVSIIDLQYKNKVTSLAKGFFADLRYPIIPKSVIYIRPDERFSKLIAAARSTNKEDNLHMLTEIKKKYIYSNKNESLIRLNDQVNDAMTLLLSEYNKIISSNYAFSKKMILWRIEQEHIKFEGVAKGFLSLRALPENSYFRYIFKSILEKLHKGDEYITLSNIEFWHNQVIDGDTFLNLNISKAKEGVLIKRIILVDSKIFDDSEENPRLISDRNNLIKIVDTFKTKLNYSRPEIKDIIDRKQLMTYFFISTTYDREEKDMLNSEKKLPYALIRNDKQNDAMAIVPTNFGISNHVPIISFHFFSDQNENSEFLYYSQKYKEIMNGDKPGELMDLEQISNKLLV